MKIKVIKVSLIHLSLSFTSYLYGADAAAVPATPCVGREKMNTLFFISRLILVLLLFFSSAGLCDDEENMLLGTRGEHVDYWKRS
jgi:hypothetical protein